MFKLLQHKFCQMMSPDVILPMWFTPYICLHVKSLLCMWIFYKCLHYQWVGLFFIYKLLVTDKIPTNIPILLQHKMISLIYACFLSIY